MINYPWKTMEDYWEWSHSKHEAEYLIGNRSLVDLFRSIKSDLKERHYPVDHLLSSEVVHDMFKEMVENWLKENKDDSNK